MRRQSHGSLTVFFTRRHGDFLKFFLVAKQALEASVSPRLREGRLQEGCLGFANYGRGGV